MHVSFFFFKFDIKYAMISLINNMVESCEPVIYKINQAFFLRDIEKDSSISKLQNIISNAKTFVYHVG